MRFTCKTLILALSFVGCGLFAQVPKTIVVPFETPQHPNGTTELKSTFQIVGTSYQVKIELQSVALDSANCRDCSFLIEGQVGYSSSLKGRSLSIPFKTSNRLSGGNTITLKIPFTFPEAEEERVIATNDWESSGFISDIVVHDFKGSVSNDLNTLASTETQSSETVRSTQQSIQIVQNKCAKDLEEITQKKEQAIVNEDFLLANELKQELQSLSDTCDQRVRSLQVKLVQLQEAEASKDCIQEIEKLKNEKEKAVASEDYLKASQLKSQIEAIQSACNVSPTAPLSDGPLQSTQIITPEPIAREDAETLDNPLKTKDVNPVATHTELAVSLQGLAAVPVQEKEVALVEEPESETERRQKRSNASLASVADSEEKGRRKERRKRGDSSLAMMVAASTETTSLKEISTVSKDQRVDEGYAKKQQSKPKKLSKTDFDFSADVTKYKRSSLHTIMLRNPGAEQADVIEQTFLDRPLPEKFNTHDINVNFISVAKKARKQHKVITKFLSENQIAKDLVAKWFNRNERGEFNMDLVAERGHYNASVFDVNIARRTERGEAMLADAGEQLIANTFVIVNDYKYVNKEEVAKKTGFLSSLVSTVASAAGADVVSDIADVATVTTGVLGKGYVVKVTSYLYRLKWDKGIANTFYEDFWIDANNYDPAKKAAFDRTDLFELELIGYETDFSGTQSTAFTAKSDAQLIERATIKATDQTIAKLQRKFEIFRTKTPLISTEPLAAKIGLKEGLEKGDKFEVLEQYLEDDGTTGLKRIGVIKVDKNHIWDNRYKASEENPSAYTHTTFSGGKKKFYPGMLIRQIN